MGQWVLENERRNRLKVLVELDYVLVREDPETSRSVAEVKVLNLSERRVRVEGVGFTDDTDRRPRGLYTFNRQIESRDASTFEIPLPSEQIGDPRGMTVAWACLVTGEYFHSVPVFGPPGMPGVIEARDVP